MLRRMPKPQLYAMAMLLGDDRALDRAADAAEAEETLD
jgi:hypothetical protein